MLKPNILIFDEQGFFYGSTQKLERQIAKILAPNFRVFFAHGPNRDEQEAKELEAAGVILVPFSFSKRQEREPFRCLNMMPTLSQIIKKYSIQCVHTPVFTDYQFP